MWKRNVRIICLAAAMVTYGVHAEVIQLGEQLGDAPAVAGTDYLIQFNGAYTNFMYAFILCQDRDMWTLMVWLYQLQQFSSQGVMFASLIVAAIPTLLVFIFCQNVIIRGIVVPTEK